MFFSRRHRCKLLLVFVGVVLLGVSLLVGCEEDLTESDEVFPDAAERVKTNLLDDTVKESEAVLRNLLNLLAALPEICSTSLATLGSFVSSLPALGNPVTSTLDDDDGSWEIIWQNVVLGDEDGPPLTKDTNTPSVDIALTVRFRSQSQAVLRAVPFTLAPLTSLQTTGKPPSFEAGGFFLFQNNHTGEWTLRWRALGETRVFEGIINAAVARVVQRVEEGENNAVTSLRVDDLATEIRFEESTAPTDDKGFTFFVRPGEIIRFRLRIGPEGGDLQDITRDQLRIGADNQPLPPGDDPGDFTLASSHLVGPDEKPADPSGPPAFTSGAEVGTFIWQDTANNNCNATTEDQWRIRFSIEGSSTTFSGTVIALEDGNDAQLRATAVGSCPAGSIEDGGRQLTYDCPVRDRTESGYDVCITRGRRVTFSPEVDEVRDPGKVFIGSQRAAPPSPYPFTMRFDFDLMERQSSRELAFSETNIVLRGNNDQDGATLLNPDQVSLDPFCSIPGEIKQRLSRVRLTGEGEYATERFEGSRYELGDGVDDADGGIEFTEDIDANDNPLEDSRRFPDRGEIRLKTRLEGELENTEITALMQDIRIINGKAVSPLDVEMNVSGIVFDFPEQAKLTIE